MKKPSSKPRGDATLKRLPDALQEELFQFLRKNSHDKTLAWLDTTHGVSTSGRALSEFFDWYPRQGFIRNVASIADQIGQEAAKLPQLRKEAQAVRDVAQVSFEIMAAQNRDSKFFLELSRERREERRLQLEREKHEWAKKSDVEKALDALHAEIAGDALALDLWQKLSARLAKIAAAREAQG